MFCNSTTLTDSFFFMTKVWKLHVTRVCTFYCTNVKGAYEKHIISLNVLCFTYVAESYVCLKRY